MRTLRFPTLVCVSSFSLALSLAACERGRADSADAVREQPVPADEPQVALAVARDCSDESVLALIGDEVMTTEVAEAILREENPDKPIPVSNSRSLARMLILARLVELEAERLELDEAKVDALLAAAPPGFRRMRRSLEDQPTLRESHTNRVRLEEAILASTGQLEVSDEEARAYFDAEVLPALRDSKLPNDAYDLDEERVHLRSVVVTIGSERPNRASVDEARADAERIAALLGSRAHNFDELLERESDRPSNRPNHVAGEYGFVTRGELPREVAKRVFAAEAGEIVLLEIAGGFEVFEVVGRFGPGPLPYEAFEEEVRQALRNKQLIEGQKAVKAQLEQRYAPIDCAAQRREQDRERKRAERERKP